MRTEWRGAGKRPEFERAVLSSLPKYNAGLSVETVRQRFGIDEVLKLASNENPYGASAAVGEAIAGEIANIARYPDPECMALRQALTRHTAIDSRRIVIGNGSENLIELLCLAFVSAGDRVLTLQPAFGLHEIYPKLMGAVVEKVPVTSKLEFDLGAWERALRMPTKLVLLSNPSNPVGCMLDTAQLLRLSELAARDSLLVVDEAYFEYASSVAAGGAGYADSLEILRRRAGPWMVLRTFSKAYGLAGLRVGYALVSDAWLAEAIDKVKTPFNVNRIAQAAARAALDDQRHMREAVRMTGLERERVRQAVGVLGMRVAPSQANFLFVDCGRSADAVSEALLHDGMIVKPWREQGYETFIRVSVGNRSDNDRFLRTIGKVMATR